MILNVILIRGERFNFVLLHNNLINVSVVILVILVIHCDKKLASILQSVHSTPDGYVKLQELMIKRKKNTFHQTWARQTLLPISGGRGGGGI